MEKDLQDCKHCFTCGEEGHRAVGCLKYPKRQGNVNWVAAGGQTVTRAPRKSHLADTEAAFKDSRSSGGHNEQNTTAETANVNIARKPLLYSHMTLHLPVMDKSAS